MTDKKISELTSITGADVSDADDILPIVDTSVATTKKITRAELFQSVSALDVDGNITVGGTVDGRDVASDGTKLDGIEAGADVTDATNVEAAGALMDSEVTNLAAVKAFDPTDYATAAQGSLADSAVQPGEAVPQTSSTGSAEIPAGTDAERDGTPSAGYFRFNTDSSSFEGYDGTAWGAIGGGVDLSAVDQDILPDADSTRDIGSTSKRWAQGWFDDVTLTNLNGNPIATAGSLSNRNKIVNGNFGINQRGVSGTVTLSAGDYGHDRWKAGASGCTYTFATSANVTTITISAGSLVQVIEGLNLQSGTHVLSWTGTVQMKIDGGSAGNSGMTGTLTGGTNATVETSGTGTLSLVQLEAGDTATPFEVRMIEQELALCQRYYANNDGAGFLIYGSNSGAIAAASTVLPVTMRSIPTLTLITDSSTNAAGLASGAIGASTIYAQVNAAGAGLVLVNVYYSVDAEL